MKNWKIISLLAVLAMGGSVTHGETSTNEQEAAKTPYPLKVCVVSGEKLGDMGKPHVEMYKGQEVRFCCKGCVREFNKDPDKYLAKLEAAKKAQAAGEEKRSSGEKAGAGDAPAHDRHGHQGTHSD